MSTVADYVGRTVDLMAFQGQRDDTEVLLTQALAVPGSNGTICTGIQKLAQRWLLEFLTVRGSLSYLPDRGCDFMGYMFRGELRTTIDVSQAFHASAAQVSTNLQAEEDTDTPDDEAYGMVTLDNLIIAGDTLTIRVTLLSVTGESRVVIMPIDVKVWS